jgi:polysaccharide export outer membrane protein
MHPKSIPLLASLTVCLALALLWTGCASGKYESTSFEPVAPPTTDKLQSGDVVQIAFPGATNMNTVQRIPLDGVIILPFVDPIPATGLTTTELQLEVLKRFESQLQLKEISITRISSAAVFYVSGAVLRPGKFPLDRPLTALEAIMEAGGPDPQRGKMDDVRIIRYDQGRQFTFKLNLKQAFTGRGDPPFTIKPFDVVHVPAKTFNF